jgi:hypothetical protein
MEPSTVVWMLAFEISKAKASPARPLAKMPDSACAADSMAPLAPTFAVFPAMITAPVATLTVEVTSA